MPDETRQHTPAQWSDAWKIDVQRGLAWWVFVVFGGLVLGAGLRVVIYAEIDEVVELLKTVLQTLFALVMVVSGFFFGNAISSKGKDETQQRMIDKLTDTLTPGTPGPAGPAGPSGPTGPSGGSQNGPSGEALAAATLVAPLAAAAAAPAAAAAAAPPAAEEAAPPAVEAELDRRGIPDSTEKERP